MKAFLSAVIVALCVTAPAHAWGEREQGILTGIAALWTWQKLNQAAANQQTQPQVIQQHPVHRYHPTFNGNPAQFIPQANMPIPTGFQEPCQFPGHHARIYDRYGVVVAIRVC